MEAEVLWLEDPEVLWLEEEGDSDMTGRALGRSVGL